MLDDPMNTTGNTIRTIAPVAAGGMPVIWMSRNVVAIISSLPDSAINMLVALLDVFRDLCFESPKVLKEMMVGNICNNIAVPYDLISSHHEPRKVVQQINALRTVAVEYRYCIPGIEAEVITGIISSIALVNGHYFVDVAPKALPWLIYCAHNVGYARLERNVVVKLPSTMKRLYIHLMLSLDSTTNLARKTFSVDELRGVLGLPEKFPAKKIRERILEPMKRKLTQNESIYRMEYTMHRLPPTGRGNRSAAGYTISLCGVICNQKDVSSQLYTILSQALAQLSKSKYSKTKSAINVCNELINKGMVADFISRVNRLSPGTCARHTANKIKKILENEYQISITN